MFRDLNEKLKRLLIALAVLILWASIGYALAFQIIEARVATALETDRSKLIDRGTTIANNINSIFGYFRGAAKTVAALPSLIGSDEQMVLNRYLKDTAAHLGADMVWIVDTKGIGIAASTYNEDNNLIGKDFHERDYFEAAMQGRSGYQFAVGKVTNAPGLYFSEPVYYAGKITGVAIAKLNVEKLRSLLVEDEAMLTDDYGVVILSVDPKHMFYAMPHAKVFTVAEAERLEHYQKLSFDPLPLSSVENPSRPEVRRFNGKYSIYAPFNIYREDAVLHLMRPLPYLESAARDKLVLAIGIAFIGFTVTYAILFLLLSFLKDRTFRAIFDNSAVGIVLIDENFYFIETNQEFRRYIGYSARELANLTTLDITFEEDRDATTAYMPNVVAGIERLERLEKRYRRKDGETVWARVSTRRYLSWAGDVQFIAVIEDITAMKNAEALLKEQEVRMLTSAKMSALGEMAAGIAHEINNPLAIISASAEQLIFFAENKMLAEEKLTNIAKKVISTTGRIAKIILGLRSFARDGVMDPPVLTSVQSIVDDTLAFCLERLNRAEIDLSIKINPSDLSIVCRPAQIAQVLLNLLNNAHDALKGSSVRAIEIGAARDEEFIDIWVTDSGPGVPPQLRDKIMHPFFTTKEIGHGTGLGLSISSGIASSHGGSFFLDEKSQNTRFVIRLPIEGAGQNPSAENVAA